LKICFFSREYPPETHIGGIGTYTFNVASALTKLGHTIHVITSTQKADFTVQNNGVWVHRLRYPKIVPKELSHFYYSLLAARKVIQLDFQFDIIQSSEFGNEAFWFSFKKNFPLVTRLATPYYLAEELDGKSFFGPRRPRFLLNWMEKKQTLSSDGIFTSTRALAKAVSKEWGIEESRIHIIPNSVNVSRIIRLGRGQPVPNSLRNAHFLLYFGRLEERKGVRVLAHALPAIFDHIPHINMVFVGSDLGYRRSSMEEYICKRLKKYRERIMFFDNLPHEQLFPIVNSAKIVILPSLWEAFGFVCVEAMALGRPVVATSGSGFEEIIEDNISGYLVEPGNSELLGQKIVSCLENHENLHKISEGARERAQDFEVSKVALRLLDYYKRIKEKSAGKKS
jgi:glycosyltransferase involved in cell wall biosynthesis